MDLCLYKIFIVTLLWIHTVNCHGRLKNPAGRSSMWRYGFKNPINYNDNELFCGGKQHQWDQQGGKCGVCGDPYDGVRANEAGGKFANGVITGKFNEGDIMSITVEITANHKGWFEFRICPVPDKDTKATQACLDRNLLREASTGETRIMIGDKWGEIISHMRLPPGVTCSQCVLQWKYHSGNSWGTDEQTRRGCVGCGLQEEFYGCADISISGGNDTKPIYYPEPATESPSVIEWKETPDEDDMVYEGDNIMVCRVNENGPFAGQAGMDQWCTDNCPSYCPETHCTCYQVELPTPKQ